MKIEISTRTAAAISGIAVIGIVVAGFIGFYTFIVPRLVALAALPLAALAGFSVAAGMLSFFAPCSLAIFPSYMGYYVSTAEETQYRKAIRCGGIASIGMILFYALLGVFIAGIGGMASVQQLLRIGIPVMAIVLTAVGIYFLAGKTVQSQWLTGISTQLVDTEQQTDRNLFLFGFGYAMSSIACIFPVFLLLIVAPLLAGNLSLSLLTFTAFASGKSSMMVGGTVLTAKSREQLLTEQSQRFQYVKQGSGLLLVLVGLYLTYYTLALYNIIAPLG
ncbi:MAG: cytochrome c biogenesis protein CcdA [Candidatus Nanohaloarchaea archaeon]|nr:cytochrome c biogenesis protein CcdA [Candidatus Nanohaloarchaea archaeon]